MQKIISTISLAVLLGMASFHVSAATLSDFERVVGLDSVNPDVQILIENGIENVPDDIVFQYNSAGAALTFMDETLPDGSAAAGLYYLKSSNIYVRVDDSTVYDPNLSFKGVLPHELGHFIYETTKGNWTSEMSSNFWNLYDYWSRYNVACYNEHETFATLYEWYITGSNESLDPSALSLIQNAESLCVESRN